MPTPQDLVDFAAARGVTILLADAPVLLTKAADWLEVQPIEYQDDPVPDAIVKAQLVCAMIYAEGGDPLQAITPRVTSETVFGAVAVTYSDSGPASPLYPQLQALLRPFMVGPGGNQFRVVRA